jgi:hypothetical protein
LSMNREVQARNPQLGAARGKEGGPISPQSWEEELERVIKAVARQDTVAGQKAVIDGYLNNDRVFVTKKIVGKHAQWITLNDETPKAWKIVYHNILTGNDVIFLPKSQVQLVEKGDEIIGLVMPGWLIRRHWALEKVVRSFIYEQVEKLKEKRRARKRGE